MVTENFIQVSSTISTYVNNFNESSKDIVSDSVRTLLGNSYSNYSVFFDNRFVKDNVTDLQKRLKNINEITENRKTIGAYYTDEDVCKYIIFNSLIMLNDKNADYILSASDSIDYLLSLDASKINDILFKYKFFDPTCGNGEFLVSLFDIKYEILKKTSPNYTDEDILSIAKTIYGNDIEDSATDICKLRLFIKISEFLDSIDACSDLSKIINERFTNIDFVLYDGQFDNKFDCVIGNPPYVESGKFNDKSKLKNDYGNIYANVIENSICSLKSNGVLGFIVPLSYSSTPRMSKIRDYVSDNASKQFILSFADRPSCLFSDVHQKLNIIVLKKGKTHCTTYTSNYKYWINEERQSLLSTYRLQKSVPCPKNTFLKIENDIEKNIYSKIGSISEKNINNSQSINGQEIYLNMRACFWIKCFSFNPGSNEYKAFKYDKDYKYFILCLLNSSLFWVYWIFVSDCWHLTSKDLEGFHLPTCNSKILTKCKKLYVDLEKKLQGTKKYIGSKQADFEFKHKECKHEIDSIDDFICPLYGLSNEETNYVKSFALHYRLGDKNV